MLGKLVTENYENEWFIIKDNKFYGKMGDELIELSKDQSEEVRWGVARNPNTPVETLIKLSRDGSTIVRARVARNLNTPIETLAKLDGDHGVTIVNNPRWKALERAGLIDVALAASKYLGIL